MYVELDPELAEILKNSNAVSTSKGNSYQLFKASAKRRRTKQEIEEEKQEEERKKLEIELKLN